MRHKFTMSLTLTATIGTALMLGACASDPLMPSKSETYSRDFIKTFGVFDQKHDWNHATQASVTVTSATPTDVKIYADVDGTRYLFGTYLGVSGSKALNVDIPKGTTQLIVNANGKNYTVDAGGKVSLSATTPSKSPSRSVEYGTYPVTVNGKSDNIVISKTDESEWRTISYVDVTGFTNTLPETTLNIYQEGVNKDFVFRSVGPIIIYPIYWNTTQPNKLGIAYKDENGEMQHIELWQKYSSYEFDHENNLLGSTKFDEYKTLEIHNFSTNESVIEILGEERSKNISPLEVSPAEYLAIVRNMGISAKTILKINGKECNGVKLESDNTKYDYNDWGDYVYMEYIDRETGYNPDIKGIGTGNAVILGTDPTACALTKGIKVDIPIGMRYGMYIERGDGVKLYSVAEYNPDPLLERDETGKPTGNYVEGEQAFHAATWVGPKFGWTWLSFEDWLSNEGSDMDLNDMVFLIDNPNHDSDKIVEIEDPDDPEPDQPEPFEWIIACEDLGAVDFDFNDIVFSVSNPVVDAEGNKTVNITALAAGGTLPVYILYNDKILTPEGTDNGEFHAWFEGNHSSTTVINANSVRAKGITYTLPVAEDFTMACCMTVTGEGNSGNMGGFKVMVEHTDNPVIISATNPNIDKELGSAPQMICVPGTWQWPTETTHILDVYEDFKKWCENGYDHNTYLWHERLTGTGYWKR